MGMERPPWWQARPPSVGCAHQRNVRTSKPEGDNGGPFLPVWPNATQRNPPEQHPTQPNPTAPNPAQPNPTPPNPTQPSQTHSSHKHPNSTVPSLTQPHTTQPNPTQPNHSQPSPAKLNPTQPNKGKGRARSPGAVLSVEQAENRQERAIVVVRRPHQGTDPGDGHPWAPLEPVSPPLARDVYLDAPDQWRGRKPPSAKTDHRVVHRVWGSACTTRVYAGSTRVSDNSGKRPIGAPNNRQQNTMASCPPPPRVK